MATILMNGGLDRKAVEQGVRNALYYSRYPEMIRAYGIDKLTPWQPMEFGATESAKQFKKDADSELSALLGSYGIPASLAAMGALSPEKMAAIRTLEDEYAAMGASRSISHDRDLLHPAARLLNSEFYRDLGRVLEPAELAAYKRQNHPVARALQRGLTGAEMPQEVYNELVDFTVLRSQELPDLEPVARQLAQAEIYRRSNAIIGNDAFLRIFPALDNVIFATSPSAGIPLEDTLRIFRANNASPAEMAQLVVKVRETTLAMATADGAEKSRLSRELRDTIAARAGEQSMQTFRSTMLGRHLDAVDAAHSKAGNPTAK